MRLLNLLNALLWLVNALLWAHYAHVPRDPFEQMLFGRKRSRP